MNAASHQVAPGGRRAGRLIARAAAGLAGLAMLLGTHATASAAVSCPQTSAPSSALSAMSADQTACWHPFGSSSPFNTALPQNPKLATDNTSVRQHIAQYGWDVMDSSTGFSISEADGTRPLYFASASDPVMTVDCTGEYGPMSCGGGNGVTTNGARIHVPAGAEPTANWDGHLTIIETDTGMEYDFWHASVSGSTITAGTGAVFSTSSSDGTNDGGDAASLALTAGLLRPSELASGHIDHALVISVPCVNANGADVGWVWPASGGWGEPCGEYWNEDSSSAPPIGSLFKLNLSDAQIAASGAPAWEQTIMTALAHYGAYAEDTNGSWHDEGMAIFMQDAASFTNLGRGDAWASTITALGGRNGRLSSAVAIPASQLEVVDPCVTRGTCPGATGPVTTSPPPPATTTTTTTPAPPTTTTTTAPPTTTTTTGPPTTTTTTTTTTAPPTTTTTVTPPATTTTTVTAPAPPATTTATRTTPVPPATTTATTAPPAHTTPVTTPPTTPAKPSPKPVVRHPRHRRPSVRRGRTASVKRHRATRRRVVRRR
jgi:hypothetical protein